MNFFEEATLRLKQELKVSEDKEAAEALGMSPGAWTARKRRDAFPETELWALSARRKDVDVVYVLRGVREGQEHTTAAAQVLRMRTLACALADWLHDQGTLLDGLAFNAVIEAVWPLASGPSFPDKMELREAIAAALPANGVAVRGATRK